MIWFPTLKLRISFKSASPLSRFSSCGCPSNEPSRYATAFLKWSCAFTCSIALPRAVGARNHSPPPCLTSPDSRVPGQAVHRVEQDEREERRCGARHADAALNPNTGRGNVVGKRDAHRQKIGHAGF